MSVESVATGSGSSSSSHGARDPRTNTMVTKRGGTWGGGERKKEKRPGVPRSLMISPNLDALLEHEDRMRQSPVSPYALSVQTTSPRSGASTATISPSGGMELGVGIGVGVGGGMGGGLPPPPRRTRGPKSPLTQVVAPLGGVGNQENVAPTTSNPYINRAPTLADVLGGDRKGDGSNAWRQQSEGGEGDRVAGFVEAAMGSSSGAAGRRRPLLSHAHSPSLSSDSTDSHAPPSTVEHEPRISISSTVYQASDADHSLDYNSDMSHRHSFIDIYSPNPHQTSFPTSEPVSPLLFARASLDSLDSASSKPPVPTTPKPTFTKPTLRSRQSSPKPSDDRLPPTTNFLDVDERADLVRKSRKLARVFGQTPGADAMAHQDTNRAALPVSAWRAHSRKKDLSIYASRRHSMPLTPDDISFLSLVSPTFEESNPTSSSRTRDRRKNRPSSPTSFIDLSEDHTSSTTDPGADTTHQAAQTPPDNLASSSVGPQPHPNTDSDAMSSLDTEVEIESAEELERRRKRERLAKLHRFLGSRVPANLVLGIDDLHVEASLPPPQGSPTPPSTSKSGSSESDEVSGSRKTWMKRRRSSSVIAPPSSWCEDVDRLKEELDDKEKAINVRRAQKMEKVFGVAPPPNALPHPHSPSPSVPAVAATLIKSAQVLPSGAVAPTDTPALPSSRNPNRTSYIHKSNTVIGIASVGATTGKAGTGKGKKNNRPGTSESAKGLLQKGPGAMDGWGFDERLVPVVGGHGAGGEGGRGDRHSNIYSHYQHSLNSLGDILDRDDRESLAELHEYLNTPGVPPHEVPPTSTLTQADDSGRATPTPTSNTPATRRLSSASLKSERRRSLPARTSLISLASLASLSSITSDLTTTSIEPTSASTVSTPKADVSSFQLRRRRAAKLTQFFGVDYRELISDVLESIENGVQAERQRGTLREEEVQDLLAKLRNLKTKRQSFI
ncbi:unnamed protein product [Cyclocybe aegerita]|uniref:Uncharacterized protein n=1 Tax=Cyclocybe aegerita TaxID=1973307 RepID=A0A8S0XSD7_CYCAE|nr:unnamed protein product [Cyclocybe aegerita]